jgi:hypothetical protein
MTHETKAMEQPECDGGANTVQPAQCLSIVNQYRGGGGSSTKETLYEFTKAIPVRETETEESPGKTLESYVAISVATAIADVFRNNGINVGRNLARILKIFEKIDESKSRGVI